MSAPETQNQNTRTLRQPTAKKGSGCGCLVFLAILLAVLGGLFYLWQNKQLNTDFPSNLNLPQFGASTGDGQEQGNGVNLSSSGGFSQSEPIQTNNTSTLNTGGNRGGGTQNQRGSQNSAPQNKNQAPLDSSNGKVSSREKVPSGYPYVKPYVSKSINRGNFKAEKRYNRTTKISYKNFLPSKPIIVGSLESLVLADHPSRHPLAIKPKQIIVFQTPYYCLDDALTEYMHKLKKLGFSRASVPINDYKRGGATVVQAADQQNNQIYLSFKPVKELTRTGWRIEIYY